MMRVGREARGVKMVGNELKRGVFFSKDKRMLQLQTENANLEEKLGIEMNIFEQTSGQLQHISSLQAKIGNENSLMEIEIMMLKKEVGNLEQQWNQKHPQIQRLENELSQQEQQYSQQQAQLRHGIKMDQQLSNTIRRYRDELKVEKMMVKSDKSMNNIKKSMQNTHQNQLKHNSILENKLQSKRRYLKVLQKKLVKQQQQQLEQEKAEKRPATVKTGYRATTGNNLGRFPSEKQFHSQAEIAHSSNTKKQAKEMKGYNDLIRKKNAILAGKK